MVRFSAILWDGMEVECLDRRDIGARMGVEGKHACVVECCYIAGFMLNSGTSSILGGNERALGIIYF